LPDAFPLLTEILDEDARPALSTMDDKNAEELDYGRLSLSISFGWNRTAFGP